MVLISQLILLNFKKAGLATIPSGTKVWFEKDGTRVSGKASFTSENNAVISFAPAFVVKAGSTESLDMYVELATTSGNDFAFASAAITSSAANVNGFICNSYTSNCRVILLQLLLLLVVLLDRLTMHLLIL